MIKGNNQGFGVVQGDLCYNALSTLQEMPLEEASHFELASGNIIFLLLIGSAALTLLFDRYLGKHGFRL